MMKMNALRALLTDATTMSHDHTHHNQNRQSQYYHYHTQGYHCSHDHSCAITSIFTRTERFRLSTVNWWFLGRVNFNTALVIGTDGELKSLQRGLASI